MTDVSGEDLYECRKRLAEDLGRTDVSPETWIRLQDLELPFDVIKQGYKGKAWNELRDTAQEFAKEEREANPTTNLPSDSRERGVPVAVGARLDDYTRLRAEAFSEVAGALANRWAEVRKFRDLHLGGAGARMSRDEAESWLYGGAAPEGALEDLQGISRRLSRAFRWRIGDSNWFVLTGHVPFVRPVSVSVHVNSHRDLPNYLNRRYYLEDNGFMVDTAEIAITAEAWVPSEIVAQAFSEVQRQVRSGDNRKTTNKVLGMVRFVTSRLGASKLRWPELQAKWNQLHPEWSHKRRNGLYEAFHNFLHPPKGYRVPKYPEYEPAPWQEAERASEERRRARLADKAEELSRRYPPRTLRSKRQ